MSINTIIIVAVILAIIDVAMIAIFLIINRRTRRIAKGLVSSWQMHNRYMDNTEAFCTKTEEIIDSLKTSIAEDSLEDKSQDYMAQCEELLQSIHGGDSIGNAIIADKKYECERASVAFEDQVRNLPESVAMDEMDLVSILGNVLDNAIEGASASGASEPFVKCESKINQSIWMLNVANSKSALNDTEARGFATTKQDKDRHGLGTKIIKSTVAKYKGTVKFVDSGEEFTAMIRVPVK